MNDNEYILGVDIGGTNIRIGAVDKEMNLTAFQKIKRDTVMAEKNSAEKLLLFIQNYVKTQMEGKKVVAAALGFPSTIDKDRRTIISTPNIPDFNNIPIVDILEKGLSFPVFVERDVSMLFFYDLYQNSLPPDGIAIGCYIGTGIGNVISINGKLLVGKDGAACELGHIPVSGKTDSCGCGNKGCLECIGAGKYLDKLVKEIFVETQVSELFTKHRNHSLIQEFIDSAAIGIATEINILNPDYILLGGGVLAMKDFPLDFLKEKIIQHTRKPFPAETLNIIFSTCSDQNGVIGAALYAQSKL